MIQQLLKNALFLFLLFSNMALYTLTGNLVFGWYDGRNTDPKSPTAYQTVEYFGAVLRAKDLDCLVNKIPLSNPTFDLGSAA